MFFVFGINEVAERARLAKSLYRREAPSLAKQFQRDNVPDEEIPARLDSAVAELVEESVKKLRPKPLAEFAMPSSAETYVQVLRATPGFREVSVKARVLAPPRDGAPKPGHRFVTPDEFASIDPSEQQHLQGMLDGSRFAPRGVSS